MEKEADEKHERPKCPFNQKKLNFRCFLLCFWCFFNYSQGVIFGVCQRFGLAKNMFAECAEIGILLCIKMLMCF